MGKFYYIPKHLRTKPDKYTCQKLHAQKRFRERYNKELLDSEYLELLEMVGRSEHLGRVSRQKSLKTMLFKEQRIWFVYDKSEKTISTFLTQKQAIENYYIQLTDQQYKKFELEELKKKYPDPSKP